MSSCKHGWVDSGMGCYQVASVRARVGGLQSQKGALGYHVDKKVLILATKYQSTCMIRSQTATENFYWMY